MTAGRKSHKGALAREQQALVLDISDLRSTGPRVGSFLQMGTYVELVDDMARLSAFCYVVVSRIVLDHELVGVCGSLC